MVLCHRVCGMEDRELLDDGKEESNISLNVVCPVIFFIPRAEAGRLDILRAELETKSPDFHSFVCKAAASSHAFGSVSPPKIPRYRSPPG